MASALIDEHDAVLLDLDGTVFRGGALVPEAGSAIQQVRQYATPIRFVTNNASKEPHSVAQHLRSLGLKAATEEVSSSAQAGAGLLARHVAPGSAVLVLGTTALHAELRALGLIPVRSCDERPKAVLQGHSPHTTWSDLAEACLAIRAGVPWVACNRDATLPTERGELPGNGAMVAALEEATDRSPEVAGKPQRVLLDRAAASAGAEAALMVGDRLETDIAGAVRAGMRSLMVMTGVGTAADLLAAPIDSRPDHVALDLRALHRPGAATAVRDDASWKVGLDEHGLLLASADERDAEPMAALRAMCAVWWRAGSGPISVRPDDEPARAALHTLGLD